jgi:integral membrane protein
VPSGRAVLRRIPAVAGIRGPFTLVHMKKSVLTRYRVMAYVTGVLLVLLTLGCIAKYGLQMNGAAGFVMAVGIAHGWLYVVYLVMAFDLGTKARWPYGKLAWVLLAGTVPTAAFFVERNVTRELEPKIAAAAAETVNA